MKAPKNIKLVKASYIGGCKYQFRFSNGIVQETDFEPIINYGESLKKFLDPKLFSKMKFNEFGDIYWGKDRDMSFYIDQYYGESQIVPSNQK